MAHYRSHVPTSKLSCSLPMSSISSPPQSKLCRETFKHFDRQFSSTHGSPIWTPSHEPSYAHSAQPVCPSHSEYFYHNVPIIFVRILEPLASLPSTVHFFHSPKELPTRLSLSPAPSRKDLVSSPLQPIILRAHPEDEYPQVSQSCFCNAPVSGLSPPHDGLEGLLPPVELDYPYGTKDFPANSIESFDSAKGRGRLSVNSTPVHTDSPASPSFNRTYKIIKSNKNAVLDKGDVDPADEPPNRLSDRVKCPAINPVSAIEGLRSFLPQRRLSFKKQQSTLEGNSLHEIAGYRELKHIKYPRYDANVCAPWVCQILKDHKRIAPKVARLLEDCTSTGCIPEAQNKVKDVFMPRGLSNDNSWALNLQYTNDKFQEIATPGSYVCPSDLPNQIAAISHSS